jgi:serine/threonine-protein kinase
MLVVGGMVSRYKILSQIGKGGMGEVFQARDTELNRPVALKVLRESSGANPSARKRFQLEARALAQLDEDSVVRIYDVLEWNGVLVLVMEFVRGTSLEELIRQKTKRPRSRSKAFDVPESARLIGQICEGLTSAHRMGLLHRDIKPSNIIISVKGRSKLLDFGLSKRQSGLAQSESNNVSMNTTLTMRGYVVGTPQYMAPEVREGKPASPQSDQYSLALVAFEMTVGRTPFTHTNGGLPVSIDESDNTLWPSWTQRLWPEFVSVVNRGLSKDPARRFPSIEEFQQALQVSSVSRRRYSRKSWWLRSLAACLLAACIGGALWSLHPAQNAQSSNTSAVTHKAEPSVNATVVFDSRSLKMQRPTLLATPRLQRGSTSTILASHESGFWHIVRQLDNTSKPIDLMADRECDSNQPDLSPDGRLIAFQSECAGGGIFIMDSNGGKWTEIFPDGSYPTWSRDGLFLSFSNAKGLYVWRFGSSEPSLVRGGAITESNWSPDGLHLAYIAIEDGQHDMWTMALGGEPIRITNDEAVESQPNWSPLGNQLYFLSNRSGHKAIWSVPLNPNTGQPIGPFLLVAGRDKEIAAFSISAEGNVVSIEQHGRSILAKARAGVSPNTSPSHDGVYLGEVPNISWDGADFSFGPIEIAVYTTDPENNVVVFDLKTGSKRILTTDGYPKCHPRISKDGTKVAFESVRNGSSQVYVNDLKGGPSRQLTDSAGKGAFNPVWAPNSSQVVFSRANDEPAIMDVRLDWTAQSIESLPPLYEDSDCHFVPELWSDNGSILGYARSQSGSSRGIRLLNLKSGHFAKITDFGRAPKLSNDGQSVIFWHKGVLYTAGLNQNLKPRPFLSVSPDLITSAFSVAPYAREVYYTRFEPRGMLYFSGQIPLFNIEGKMILPHY